MYQLTISISFFGEMSTLAPCFLFLSSYSVVLALGGLGSLYVLVMSDAWILDIFIHSGGLLEDSLDH